MSSNPKINPNYKNDIAFIGQVTSLNNSIIATFGYHIFTLPESDYINNHVEIAKSLLLEQFQWTMENED